MLKSICRAMLLIGFSGVVGWAGEEPHPEPIVSTSPPKPNIMMVLDTSGSMTTKDMDMPDGYQPLSRNTIHLIQGGLGRRKVSRAASMQWTVLGLMDRYRQQANMGFAPLDSRSSWWWGIEGGLNKYYKHLHNVGSIESAEDYEAMKKALLDLEFTGSTPLNSPVYTASLVQRGLDSRIKRSPIEYRCQEQHIILLTDGKQNETAYKHSVLPSDRPLSTTLNSLGAMLGRMDVIAEAKNKQPNDSVDRSGHKWLSEGYRKMPIYVHAVRFSSGAAVEDRNLAQFVSHTDGRGVFVTADNTAELEVGFHKIFQNIIESLSGTGSYEDQQGASRTVGSIRYVTYYDPINWTGEIKAERFTKTKDGASYNDVVWSTAERVRPNQGQFITYQNGVRTPLERSSGLTEQQVSWLKGNHVNGLRVREGALGDIIDSLLTYSAKDELNINLNIMGDDLKEKFLNYLVEKNRNRQHYNYLITGSNDGLINFIYGERASGRLGGTRHTSYFPSFFNDEIGEILDPMYQHNFKANGTTHLFDAQIKDRFATIGLTAMGAGKEGLVGYQLFSNSGQSPTEITPLFEIERGPQYKHLGYTYSGIEFLNVKNAQNEAQAVAIFGNGYTGHLEAQSQRSAIYIIDAYTGKKIEEILLPNGVGGASTPAAMTSVDSEGYQQLDRLYVGDQSGKLFKITFDTSANHPLSQYEVTLLFDSGPQNPITVKPTLVETKNGEVWIYFGTGRAILASDDGPQSLVDHYFYGIKDIDHQLTRADLTMQEIIGRNKAKPGEIISELSSIDFIEVSNYPKVSPLGWYIPLKMKGGADKTGERVIFPASIYQNRSIVFSTYGIQQDEMIKQDPCSGGGIYGKMLFVDLYTGGGSQVFGQNGSGLITDSTSFGSPSGPGINGGNYASGGYMEENDYSAVIRQITRDNPESSHIKGEQLKDICDLYVEDIMGKGVQIPRECQRSAIEPQRIYLKNMQL